MLDEVEKKFILLALKRTNGNKTKAAKLLGLSRDTLRYRIDKFQLDDEGQKEQITAQPA